MGIIRAVEWKLVMPPSEASVRIRAALKELGMDVTGDETAIRAKTSRAILKNRWAAEMSFDLEPFDDGTLAVVRVDMLGTKHYAVLSDVAESLGDESFDDRGVADAVKRLGKMGRLYGRKEVRHLHHLLRGAERVIILGRGSYNKKQGLVVLTNERLFFFEKSLLGQETVEDFALKAITSLETGKKMTGERLVVHISGNRSEITNMIHGQADEITREFRRLMTAREAPSPARTTAPQDPLEQLERLASLHEKGLITAEEFEQKKADLLSRV